METLISVIVPVYNIEHYISKCVKSIMQQDYSNIEIILVDDGSKDRSGIICDELQHKDRRIKVVHKKNGGLSDARNAGVEAAQGEYVLFIDGDDYVDNNYVSSLLNALAKHDSTMACSPLIFEYSNGNQKASEPFKEQSVSSEDMIDIVFRAKYSIGVSACSKLMRIQDVRNHPFPVGKYHEDMITIEDIILENVRIAIVPTPTYHYVQRKSSITYADVNFDSLNYGLKFLEKKISKTESLKCANAYIHRMFGLMNTYCRVIKVKESKEQLRSAQKILRKELWRSIKDKKTTMKIKIRNVFLCVSIHTFSFLQYLEREHSRKSEG